MSLEVFTLWVGESLYGIDISDVLSIHSDVEKIQKVPVDKSGLLGIAMYQNLPTPVFGLSQCLKMRPRSEEREELVGILTECEKDHVDWLSALETSIKTGVPFVKATDPHQCAFGKWYDAFRTSDEMLQEILAKFDEPHCRIHGLAEQLITLSDNGKQHEALEIIAHERKTTLGQLKRLFHLARMQIKDNIRPVIIYITENGQTPTLGLLVDQVNDVVTYDESTLLNVEKSNLNRIHGIKLSDSLLKGFVRDAEGRECFLLRPTKLLELKEALDKSA